MKNISQIFIKLCEGDASGLDTVPDASLIILVFEWVETQFSLFYLF